MKGLANVGDILAGKYRVERIIGIGGMGMVVAATHLELDQIVAIKFMLPAALESKEAVDRFMREARAAGRLTSEHVCRVSDVGKFDSGVPYIVMEYLDGFDLGTLLKRRGPLKIDLAVDYIIQASEGMAEAHGHGIVHRDLKPDNLFLHNRTDGSAIVKVLDFGISKASVTGIATKTGDIMGSPAYMAPEQMQSTKDVDQRADIWSLGVILYQLISGRMPFVADTLPALCMAVINDAPPSLESVRKDLPHGLAQVVMKCLAKRKEDRFRNVHELAQSLAPYGKPESASAITRIRGMLQRKRPPTPPPLMMLPSEFSDIAPTLVGDEDIPSGVGGESDAAMSGPSIEVMSAKLTGTTIGSGSAESLSIPGVRKPFNRGVVGALLGAIALVALIIVMVIVRRSDKDASAANMQQATQPPPPPAVTAEPPPPPVKEAPAVEPVTPPAVDVIEETPVAIEDTPVDAKKQRDKKKDKSKTKTDKKDPPETGSGAGSASQGSATPPPPDEPEEDKWDRMHHDKKDEPKETP